MRACERCGRCRRCERCERSLGAVAIEHGFASCECDIILTDSLVTKLALAFLHTPLMRALHQNPNPMFCVFPSQCTEFSSYRDFRTEFSQYRVFLVPSFPRTAVS